MSKAPKVPTTRNSILLIAFIIFTTGLLVWFPNFEFSYFSEAFRRRLSQSGLLFTYAGVLFMAYDLFYGAKHAAARALAEAELAQIEVDRARCKRITMQHASIFREGRQKLLAKLVAEEAVVLTARRADAARKLADATADAPRKLLSWAGIVLIALGTAAQFIGIR